LLALFHLAPSWTLTNINDHGNDSSEDHIRRTPLKLHRAPKTRRVIQWVVTAVTIAIGVQFSLWVIPHLSGRWPSVSRPPGVEAFLPIDAMLGLSELLGRLGIRIVGRTLTPPKWLDIPLRGLKYLLLGFFAWAVWWTMDPQAVESFLESPYAKIVDAKMWLFFVPPSRLTIAVLGVLIVGSVFVRDLWCRYLCPYGALVGLLGILAPLKVTRDPDLCTDCHECTKLCPARLPVHRMKRVASVECTSCQDCVVSCPVEGCLAVRPPLAAGHKRWMRPAVASLVAIGLYLAVITGFRVTGNWHTSITEAEFHERLQEIDSPLYTHVGGQAMTEE